MNKDNDTFEELAAALQEDPDIKAAVSDHEAACAADEEDHCVICQARIAIRALMFIKNAINDNTCDCETCEEEGVSELDIATALVDNLEGGLSLISVCQQGIQLLTDITQATAFIIAQNELDDEHDHDHVYDDEEDENDDE